MFSGGRERVQSTGEQSVSLQTMPFQQLAHSAWQSHWIQSVDGSDLLHYGGNLKESLPNTETLSRHGTFHGLLQLTGSNEQTHIPHYPQ